MIHLDEFADVLMPFDKKQQERLEKIVDLLNELDYHIALMEADQTTKQ